MILNFCFIWTSSLRTLRTSTGIIGKSNTKNIQSISLQCMDSSHSLPNKSPSHFVIQKALSQMASGALILSSIFFPFQIPMPVFAFGPTDIDIVVTSYKPVELCNGKKPVMPGQKAMEGLFPVCIEVEADVINPDDKKSFSDVGVFGFVKENNAGNSVLPNNPDFRSDSGQYAMIANIPPGKSHQTFQFVAAVSGNPKVEAIPGLTFDKTKARAYPGGAKFKALDICEVDPRADGCSQDLDDE